MMSLLIFIEFFSNFLHFESELDQEQTKKNKQE